MNEIIQNIMDNTQKKTVQSLCKKILKKCSMKSSRDIESITYLALWLYIYGYYQEAILVCDLFHNEKFSGNYTLWNSIDHAYCIKARILREQGHIEESQQIIEFINQYRHPELYINLVEWFRNTLDKNIQSNLDDHCKAGARDWRLIKLKVAIAYREAGQFPISDDEFELIIENLKSILLVS